MNLIVDEKRMSLPETGIYVRACLNGKWDSYDIVNLDAEKPAGVASLARRSQRVG